MSIFDESMSCLSVMRIYVQNILITVTYILCIYGVDMKVSPVLHFTSALTMKTFLAVVLLAALGLMAEANLEHLKPRDAVMPVNPMYTAQEWQEIYAAQKLSPEYPPNYKQGYAGKVDVPLDEENQRITNGIVAAPCQFPWQVAVITDYTFFCGGSLISSQWVLTAAHCVDKGSTYLIILGTNEWNALNPPALALLSYTTIIHKKYDFPNNDIALIKLPIEVTFTSCVKPIRLRYIEDCLDGKPVRVSGWGSTYENGPPSPILMYADLTVITNTACANVFGPSITCSILCTSTPGGVSMCQGDSGGPLVYLEKDGVYTQVGIISFVATNGCTLGYPAGFTRVNKFLCWIAKHTDITFCFCP